MDKKAIALYEHPHIDRYLEPGALKDRYIGKTALVIGSGPSSKKLLQYKALLRKNFDVILGLNFTIRDFEDVLDYLMVTERKPTRLARWIKKFATNKEVKYIFNEEALRFFRPTGNIIKAKYADAEYKPDIRNYTQGFFNGYNSTLINASVIVHAMHMVGVMGCSNLYLSGAELCFDDKRHYYDKNENLSHKDVNRLNHPHLSVKSIKQGDRKRLSVPIYIQSAKTADKLIATEFKRCNLNVYDFSDGLITEATKVGMHNFFTK